MGKAPEQSHATSSTGPLIGITANVATKDASRLYYRNKELHYIDASVSEAVRRAGGIPIILPIPANPDDLAAAEMCAGIVLSPGLDVHPSSYGCRLAPSRRGKLEVRERDEYEMELVRQAATCGTPLLGICRGLQVINVALGGSLFQDLDNNSRATKHRDLNCYDRNRHNVSVAPGSILARTSPASEQPVVSVHDQAVARLGNFLTPTASADDGIIEALEYQGHPFLVGVQWHAEWMPNEPLGLGLLRMLVNEAKRI